MRSIALTAATTVILAAVWGCGGDSNVGPNTPVANFTQQCTDLTCTFTDASTPAGQVSWAWDFGDPNSGATNNTATIQNPTHTFSAANTYQVKLTVTLTSSGATNSKTTAVTVTAPANPPPTASFSVPACGVGVDCEFHSTSTDVAPGTITATHWDFGDASSPNNTADGVDVSHSYATAGAYSVTLTVTDNGGATGTTTQSVTVLPAAAENCTISGTVATCTLDITLRSTVKLTLTSRDCELVGNKIQVGVQARLQTAFSNVCARPFPSDYTVTGAGGAPAVFEPGTQLQIVFTQGTGDPTDPVPGSPAARVEGTSPDWTVTIDDGGNPSGQNEPDFNDVILAVHATAAP